MVHDGGLIWKKGYGVADTDSTHPVSADTRFRIASITKMFTATAILQLRESGRLSLDDEIRFHLDWCDLQHADGPPITIRHLLTHTSGLPRDAHEPMWTACSAPSRGELVAAIGKLTPTRVPLEAFAYSNFGYSLLGLIAEKVAGLRWSEYLQRFILDPLGMTSTQPVPKEDDAERATGYYRSRVGSEHSAAPFYLLDAFEASANIASTVADLAKFAAAHLSRSDTAILPGHVLRDMHRAHWLHPTWDGGYGLGSAIVKLGKRTICGHSGMYNGYASFFHLDREDDFGVIVLTNSGNADTRSISNRAFELVLPEILSAIRPPKRQPDPAWEAYVGNYSSPFGTDAVVIRGSELQVVALDTPDLWTVTLLPTDVPHTFTIKEAGQSNEQARFELGESGRVVRLWMRNEVSDRAE